MLINLLFVNGQLRSLWQMQPAVKIKMALANAGWVCSWVFESWWYFEVFVGDL